MKQTKNFLKVLYLTCVCGCTTVQETPSHRSLVAASRGPSPSFRHTKDSFVSCTTPYHTCMLCSTVSVWIRVMNVFWTLLICIQQSLVDLPFSALTLLVRRQEGHTACKKTGCWGLLVVMIWLELCKTYSSSSPVVTTTYIILCFNKHRLTQVHLENGR